MKKLTDVIHSAPNPEQYTGEGSEGMEREWEKEGVFVQNRDESAGCRSNRRGNGKESRTSNSSYCTIDRTVLTMSYSKKGHTSSSIHETRV